MKKNKLTIFENKIFYYENVLENIEELIYTIESTNDHLSGDSLISSWHPWKASNGEDLFGMKKSTNSTAIENANIKIKNLFNLLDTTLDEYGKDYADQLGIEVGKKMPISISKYFLNSFMGPHTDSPPEPTFQNFSAVMYLNDNYAGGEIHFPEQGVKIKPTRGSLVIFPSIPPFYHESLKILNGVKYICPAFWHLQQ
jgi:hypothetical protein